MNLIELTNSENKILELALNEELSEEQFNLAVQELSIAIKEKGASYIKVLDNLKNNIEQGKLYKKEIDSRLKKMENTEKRIKNYIILAMENAGLKTIDTEIGKITYSAGRDSVDVIDEEEIPKKFKTIEYVEKIDKKAILEEYKTKGEIVDGVDIVQKPYITVK